jgi:hypothetical protein
MDGGQLIVEAVDLAAGYGDFCSLNGGVNVIRRLGGKFRFF